MLVQSDEQESGESRGVSPTRGRVALQHLEANADNVPRRAPEQTPEVFVTGRIVAGARQTFARLDAWLARFGHDVLFTVTVNRPRRCPIRKQPVCRDEHHRQVSVDGVRRLAQRHGAHLRRIEPERIGAKDWAAAIERFGTCE
jgi:hypothetical protein